MGCRFAHAALFPDAPAMSTLSQNSVDGSGDYPVLKIHSEALRHNLTRFREIAPRSKVLLPVKANAYGCGIATLFPFFQSEAVDMLGVANCHEAVQLRALGWSKPVLNLGGFFRENIAAILKHDITVSLTDLWQVEALQSIAVGKKVPVHIKLDLGMGRIGLQRNHVTELLSLLKRSPAIRVDGIFTHFPHSGPDARTQTLRQNSEFEKLAGQIIAELKLTRREVILHTANSYSAAFFPETHHDMIRPGILFYGYYQSEADRENFDTELSFRPCLELVATPISHRTLARGEGISYASLYHVGQECERVAVLPLGYADGIPRALSNAISFGSHALRGRVTMDQIIVENSDGATSIRLLGPGMPSLELWGDMAHSFSYEIMSHLGNRLRRVLV
jgi:alanine racemase